MPLGRAWCGFIHDCDDRPVPNAHVVWIGPAGSDNHAMPRKLQPADPVADPNDLPIRWLFDETSHVDGQFTFEFVPSMRWAVGHVSGEEFFLTESVMACFLPGGPVYEDAEKLPVESSDSWLIDGM